MTDCIVIGGGAAGLFAAGVAASGGLRVQLLEKNENRIHFGASCKRGYLRALR